MYNEEKERELALGALLVYELAGLPFIRPYAGVGFELSLTHTEYSWVDSTDLGSGVNTISASGEYDSNGGVFCAVGGIRWPVTARLSAISEIKYVAYGEDYYALFLGLTYRLKD